MYRCTSEGWIQYDCFDTKFLNGIPCDFTPHDFCYPVKPTHCHHDIWKVCHRHQLWPEKLPSLNGDLISYLAATPEWENYLFSGLSLYYEPYELYQWLAHGEPDDPIFGFDKSWLEGNGYAVSDGSSSPKRMSFGWMLSLPSGKRLVECSGPVYGVESSHRAEATGLLSVLKFVVHLSEYCNRPIPKRLHFASDNRGLIQRVKSRKEFTFNYTTNTLTPDWDLIKAIHTQYTKFEESTLEHVKGHQDKKVAYEDLPLVAQLNVDADMEAGNYALNNSYRQDSFTTCDPIAGAQLYINDTVITNNYRQQIRYSAAMPDYMTKLQEIYNWHDETITRIDFTTRKQAITRFENKIFLFKFQHRCLPTQAHKAKCDGGSDVCPLCQSLDDQDHFMCCRSPSLCEVWGKEMTTFRNYLEHLETAPTIVDAFMSLLYSIRHNQKPPPFPTVDAIKNAMSTQLNIGKWAWIRGYWTEAWARIQHRYLVQNDMIESNRTGIIWMKKVIQKLWYMAIAGWQAHNVGVHGTSVKLDMDLRQRAIARIDQLYELRSKVVPTHIDYLFPQVMDDFVENSSTSQLRTWIKQYEAAIYHSVTIQKQASLVKTKTLSSYFNITKKSKRTPPPKRIHKVRRTLQKNKISKYLVNDG